MGVTGEPAGFPEFLAVLRRSRTLVLVTLLASLAIGAVVSARLPVRYRAAAIMLPPDDRGLPPLTRTERESLAAGPRAPGPLDLLETPAGLAARLIRSAPVRTIAARHLPPASAALLESGVRSWVTDEKVVYVEVEGPDPAAAAEAANALVGALDEFNLNRRRNLAHSLAVSLEPEVARASADSTPAGRAVLEPLASELARARRDAADPRPSVELLEAAHAPARPAEPVKWAVMACFLLAGFLGATAGAFLRDALTGSRAGAGRAKPSRIRERTRA